MEDFLNTIGVPAIAAIVYWVINLVKYTTGNSEKFKRFIPLCSAVIGIILALIAFFCVPDVIPTTNIFTAIVIGCASGLTATGFNQIVKQMTDNSEK